MWSKMDEQQILERSIELISRLMGVLETEAFEQEGFSDLSMRQLLYVETIARLENPTFSELAEALSVSKPSVTALVHKLIRMGYLKKIQSQEDRRVYHINLAEKGLRFTEMHANVHRLMAERLTARLDGEQISQLAALLKTVVGE